MTEPIGDERDGVPFDDQEGYYTCPDCEREGVDFILPLSAFYVYHADRYANEKRRSPYCRRHTDARTSARLKAKLDPDSPDYDPELHERQKGAKRAYSRRKLRPASPWYDQDLHERQKRAKRLYISRRRQRSAGE